MKRTLFIIVSTLLVTVMFIIMLEKIDLISFENKQIAIEEIPVNYTNNYGEIITIRYKYFLNYETTSEITKHLDFSAPVFSLKGSYENELSFSMEDYERLSIFPKRNDTMTFPSISNPIVLIPKETVYSSFYIEMNENYDKNKIRVDVKIIVERLNNGKWIEDYQVIFMERGLYWSLDKGPIEFIQE